MRIARIPQIVLALAAVFLVAAVILVSVLFFTEGGFRLVARAAEGWSQGQITITRVTGSLGSRGQIHGLEVQTPDGLVTLRQGVFRWQPWQLLRGTLHIEALQVEGVAVTLRGNRETQAERSEQSPSPVALPLNVQLDLVSVKDISVLFSQGTPHMIDLIELRGRSVGSTLHLAKLVVEAPGYGARLEGQLGLGEDDETMVEARGRYVDRQAGEVRGSLRGHGTLGGSMKIDAAVTAPAQMTLQGEVNDLLGAARWHLQFAGEPIAMQKINGQWPELTLATTGKLSGNRDSYGGSVVVEGQYKEFTGNRLEATFTGTATAVTFTQLQLASTAGTVDGKGQVTWGQNLSWQGDVVVNHFNPGIFLPQFQGDIDTTLVTAGRIEEKKLFSDINIVSLNGMLRDYTLEGSGAVAVAGDSLNIQNVSVRSGESSLEVAGVIDDEIDLRISVKSPDVAQLLPGAAGTLHMAGQLTGSVETPRVLLDFAVAGLRYDALALDQLTGKIDTSFAPGGILSGTVSASRFSYNDERLDSLELSLAGTAEEHGVELQVQSSRGSAAVRGQGSFLDKRYRSTLNSWSLKDSPYGDWQGRAGASVGVAPGEQAVDNLCLVQDGSEICLSGSTKEDDWQLQAEIKEFDLGRLKQWQLLERPLDGRLSGTLDAAGQGMVVRRTKGNLQAENVTTSLRLEEEERQVTWQGNSLDLTLDDGVLRVGLLSSLVDGSSLAATVDIENGGDLRQPVASLPLTGTIDADLQDLSPLALLTGQIVQPSGYLKSHIRVGGVVAHPQLQGNIILRQGKFFVPSVGLSLEDVTLSLEGAENGIDLDYVLRSGQGLLTGTGNVVLSSPTGWQAKLTGQGTEVELVNLPEYHITANPDVSFSFSQQGGVLEGSLFIPQARIAPGNSSTSVSASSDVIFVDEVEEAAPSPWPLRAIIDLNLGQQVTFESFGLTGRLTGNMKIEDLPGKIMTATGELTVHDGSFSLYNKMLDIERGRLVFVGGSIDNPGVDVRAQRIIGDTTVGADVSGTADDLTFSLFSNPTMEQSDILAYLLVGRASLGSNLQEGGMLAEAATALGLSAGSELVGDLGDLLPIDDVHLEGGRGTENMSLVIGTHLTEDFYISYDHNFYNSVGEFRVRYDLGLGFSIETRNSVEGTGADIRYSFEK